jgi:hypothetical protein
MLVASTSVVGFGFGRGKAQNERMFFRLAPKADIQSARSTCYSRRQLFANATIAGSRVAS